MRKSAGALVAIAIPLLVIGFLYVSMSPVLAESIGVVLILAGLVLLAIATSPTRPTKA